MILTFSKPVFKDQIISGHKRHTIREDKKERWRPYMDIHFWLHNPRNKSKNPHQFGKGICTGIEEILIDRNYNKPHGIGIYIGGRSLTPKETEQLIQNDGLTPDQFRRWFLPPGEMEFYGRIIHWTNLSYSKNGNANSFKPLNSIPCTK
ncbi:MAG: hypothetical protein KDC34_19125 [Saprospiraceae bacterium]|nr:hypothetical protein [Saprospiraceae bacterium]